jgi:1,4-alpha-glucan branching enzyme/maltooligosyltrehalose trehalohydrolase
MLFMGEEFAAATPFQFFCDFQGELADAVTEGRRREFAGFREFADPAARARIPDPNDPATFKRCKLNWDCMDKPKHKAWLEHYRSLLALRSTHVVPRLPGMGGGAKFELVGASGLAVRWRLGDGAQLTLLANLGDSSIEGAFRFAGTPFYLSQPNLPESLVVGHMPPWSAACFIKETQL